MIMRLRVLYGGHAVEGDFTQKMLSVLDWANFFNNPENK